MSTPYLCPTCGETHRGGCHAHKKAKKGGGPCHAPISEGAVVCKWHGGNTPQAKAKAAERAAMLAAQRGAVAAVARFGARTDVTPAEALLELVHYQSGIVAYWRARVDEIDDPDLEWGVTKHDLGDTPSGEVDRVTREAVPHLAYRLMDEAQQRLAEYAAQALRAGVEERQIRVAESQGALLAAAVQGILDDLALSKRQLALVSVVVPKHLRRVSGAVQ